MNSCCAPIYIYILLGGCIWTQARIQKYFDKFKNVGSILTYTKNGLVSWYDDKEISSGLNVLKLSKKKKKKVSKMYTVLSIDFSI